MADPLLRALREQCRALMESGQSVVCAVSGGADSMALLWCLHTLQEELGISLCAAHFNHRLRGAESERDEAFVRDFCRAHGIRLHVGGADAAAYAVQSGKSVEEAARELRYAFLESLPADRIATAHHADDNAETVVLNLLRGTGLRGLAGIPRQRGRIIRPLLAFSRAELRAFLQRNGIQWVEDSTNAQTVCTRNRLRHTVMPLLEKEAPHFTSSLAALTADLRAEDEYLNAQAAQVLAAARTADGDLHCAAVLAAPAVLRSRVLRLWLGGGQDLSRSHIRALLLLLESADPSAQVSLPHGRTVCRRYEYLTLQRETPTAFDAVALDLAGVTHIPALGIKIICKPLEKSEKFPNSPFQFVIGYDKIHGSSVFVRPRQIGDTICLPSGHHTTLKKLFIDRKLPRSARARIAVIASGTTVLAVEGIGRNEDMKPATGAPALSIIIEKEET